MPMRKNSDHVDGTGFNKKSLGQSMWSLISKRGQCAFMRFKAPKGFTAVGRLPTKTSKGFVIPAFKPGKAHRKAAVHHFGLKSTR